MREIKTHRLLGEREGVDRTQDDDIEIRVLDSPGVGGACHLYSMGLKGGGEQVIHFQEKPRKEVGVNGVSIEALLAICKDRLEGFQTGKFVHMTNQIALEHVDKALEALHVRSRDRVKRGVEGVLKE